MQVNRPLSIAIAITMSRVTQCPFAIRSGGHSDVPGASNVEGGVTIDMSRLNEVTVSRDQKSVYIGAGAKWGDVYQTLDALELSVIGGRAASVGVGGLTLGGGIIQSRVGAVDVVLLMTSCRRNVVSFRS